MPTHIRANCDAAGGEKTCFVLVWCGHAPDPPHLHTVGDTNNAALLVYRQIMLALVHMCTLGAAPILFNCSSSKGATSLILILAAYGRMLLDILPHPTTTVRKNSRLRTCRPSRVHGHANSAVATTTTTPTIRFLMWGKSTRGDRTGQLPAPRVANEVWARCVQLSTRRHP